MKKILFSSLITLISYHSNAQIIALNEVDEFTNNKIIKATTTKTDKWKSSDDISESIYNALFLSTKYIKSDSDERIFITLDFGNDSNFCVDDNGEVIFLFNNKSTVNFKQVSGIKCNNRIAITYQIDGTIYEQLETLETLTKFVLDKLRIYTSDGYFDFNVKQNKVVIIRNHWLLLLEEINKSKL